MQNSKSVNLKNFRFWVVILLFSFYIFNLIGCATVPRLEQGLTSYNLNGIAYVPLISLCELKNINWNYDTFARKVTLSSGADQVNLMLGSSLVIVNGVSKDIRYPVDIYKGTIVVPYRFKEEIADTLFKPPYPKGMPALYFKGIKRIVIDPGHGGSDPGAIGRTGVREKDVCLDISKRLKNLLAGLGLEVVLSREYDKTLSLSQRVALANNYDADLFISVHANSNRARRLSGFETYYLSSKIDDGRRALLAAENADLKLEKASILNPNFDLKATIWDLIYTQNRAESIGLAQRLCQVAGDNLNTKVLGVKGAPFYVLKNAKMPAVLIEVGFLSNPFEEKMLRNNFYRQQIAETLALGIKSYCQEYIIAQSQER